MHLRGKNILLISPEPWDHIFVSKHHYATHLAKRGNTVFFLNPPSRNIACESTIYKNLYSVSYTGFIKGLRFLPKAFQKILFRSKFVALQKKLEVKFDIVWSFDNSVFYDFSALPEEVFCISHIVDLNQDFEFEKASSTANLCLATTDQLVRKLQEFNKKAFFVNHGVNLNSNNQLVTMPGVNSIKCFYAGNLNSKYLDQYMLTKIIEGNPLVDFLFAGPASDNSYLQLKNSYHVGVLNSAELNKHYNSADLLLICYLANIYEDQLANPHKMMEYLATGKMVIASLTKEYIDLKKDKLIEMTEKNESLPQLFKSVVTDLDDWNSIEKKKKRQEFAKANSYSKQVDKIEKLIASV